jgi:hypothetical protein
VVRHLKGGVPVGVGGKLDACDERVKAYISNIIFKTLLC